MSKALNPNGHFQRFRRETSSPQSQLCLSAGKHQVPCFGFCGVFCFALGIFLFGFVGCFFLKQLFVQTRKRTENQPGFIV